MRRAVLTARALTLAGVAGLALLAPACGDDSGASFDDPDSAMAGAASSDGGAGSGVAGESESEEGGGSDQGSPGAAGHARGGSSSAAAGTSASAAGEAAAAGGDSGPPGLAPGGGSVYAIECRGQTEMCGVEGAHCLGVNLDTGGAGYACSNHCSSVADCSDAPTGAAAQAGCVQFKQEKRCVLVCYNQPNEYACPDGMSCYVYPNSPIGYCLWTD